MLLSQSDFKGLTEDAAYKATIAANMPHYYVAFREIFPDSKRRSEIETKIGQYKKVLVGNRAEFILSQETLRKQYNWNGESTTSPWTASGGSFIRIPPEPIWEGQLTYGNLLLGGTFREKADGLHVYRLTVIIYPTAALVPAAALKK